MKLDKNALKVPLSEKQKKSFKSKFGSMHKAAMGIAATPTPTMPDAAPREIDLSTDDAKVVYESIDTLKNAAVQPREMVDIFDHWQSPRTTALKKLFISTSMIVGFSLWIGVQLNQISLLGFELGEGSVTRFIIFLTSLIFVSGFAYEISRRVDLAVMKAKIPINTEDIGSCIKAAENIDDVVKRNDIKSASALLRDFRSGGLVADYDYSDIKSYKAVNFFKTHLEGASITSKSLELVEIAGTYLLAIFALYQLLLTAFPWLR